MTRRLLITGASGNIGSKLAAYFGAKGYDLRLLDLKPGPGIVAADIGDYDPGWVSQFEGVDTVIHLAGNPHGYAPWSSALRDNIGGTQHVLRAAREARVRRAILASTVQVMNGYRFAEGPITPDMPPGPTSPYGISKLMLERMGYALAEETGISVIAFRIGYFQKGENVPGPHMRIGAFGQSMWLSNRDMNHGMERAIEADNVPFAVLNLISANPGSRWDISLTRETIGYDPQDGHVPVMTPELLAEDAEASAGRFPPGSWFTEFFKPVEG